MDASAATLEELHGPLVLFGGGPAAEGAEVPPPPGSRVTLAGVEPVLPRLEFPNHARLIGKRKLAGLALRPLAVRPATFHAFRFALAALRFATASYAFALLRLRLIQLVGFLRTTCLIRNTVLFAHGVPSDEYRKNVQAWSPLQGVEADLPSFAEASESKQVGFSKNLNRSGC